MISSSPHPQRELSTTRANPNLQPSASRGPGLALELQLVELLVKTAVLDQLAVRASLNNSPLVQDDDQIGLLNRRESMGDANRSPATHQLFQCRLDGSL